MRKNDKNFHCTFEFHRINDIMRNRNFGIICGQPLPTVMQKVRRDFSETRQGGKRARERKSSRSIGAATAALEAAAALFTVAINSGTCKLGTPTCGAAAAAAVRERAFVQNISAPWRNLGPDPGRRIDY